MSDIAAFLNARIDDDQRAAERMAHQDPDGLASYLACPATRSEPLGDLPFGEENCDCGMPQRRARALREVAAKRAILAAHRPARFTDVSLGIRDATVCLICHAYLDEPDDWPEDREWLYPLVQQAWPCPTVRALAGIHSDHAEFDPSWSTKEQT